LLLASGLSPQEVAGFLTPFGVQDPARADASLQSLAGEPYARTRLALIVKDLLASLALTADPDQALTHWERFVATGMSRTQLFDYLKGSQRMLHLLSSIFGNSEAMAQTLVRDPMLMYWLAEPKVLLRRPTRDEMDRTARASLKNVSAVELKLDALRRFRRREMLRIGVRDLLHMAPVPETTAALSDLAAVMIQLALESVEADLQQQHGTPMTPMRGGKSAKNGFTVMAMGKLGGGELNYSSDVDLIFVHASDEGETRKLRGASSRFLRAIPNEEYFELFARALSRALAEPTQEGYIYRVDLRLRAEGTAGRLSRSVRAYRDYYEKRGEGWERLALLKAWPIAGDLKVGQAFLRAARPFVYGKGDAAPGKQEAARIIVETKAVKDMIDAKMADRGQATRNVKLGTGGIREIEFLVQAIQVLCGRTVEGIRTRSTLDALARFRKLGLLSAPHEAALREAYIFLRDVEHKLQMVLDLQTHALPDHDEENMRCAVRLGYLAENRVLALKQFKADLLRHTTQVNRLFLSLFANPERSPLLAAALALARRRT
jgi:glutamate-ammonia-ligase adenylyltransferase